jgi:hypothetical protein
MPFCPYAPGGAHRIDARGLAVADMTGLSQFGPLQMGGMFTVMKVREDLGTRDYKELCPYIF